MDIPPDRTALAGVISDANPMGTDGFEFVEFTGPDMPALEALFERMGFSAVARHRSKQVALWRQGQVNFILNAEPASFAQAFQRVHGPSACAWHFAWPMPPPPTSGSSPWAPSRSRARSGRWS